MRTLDIKEAAEFLKIHEDRLQRRASAGEIPGVKNGRCWVFIDIDLADWMRGNYKTSAKPKEEQCRSTSVVASTGASGRSAAKELEKRLAQKIPSKHRNGMTAGAPTYGANQS